MAAGTTCRASAGACDVAETCDGSSAACPANARQPAGSVCRAQAYVCDKPETCDGSSDICPTDGLFQTSDHQLCRAQNPMNDCSSDSFCNGAGPGCPVAWQPAGTVCRRFSGGVVTGCGQCTSSGVCLGPYRAPSAGGTCP